MNIFNSSGFKVPTFNLSRFNFPVILLLFAFLHPEALLAQETYNIATYNIRYAKPNDEGNLWEDRAPHLINLIRFHEMDIIGAQEGLFNQLEMIKEGLNFLYIGVGRNTGNKEGEFSAVFYKLEKRIDYIFVNDGVGVIHQSTISDNYGKKHPSDHFPVIVKVRLGN